jgi:YYY domain-containing protein
MVDFFLWYIIVVILGLLTFPLNSRIFKNLADRGYFLSRPLGLLLWGYIFWMLTTLGLIQNDPGGALFALVLVALISILVTGRSGWGDIQKWFKGNGRLVLKGELLFLTAFCGWALIRAMSPDVIGTEKPMELAFINAILRSPTFPPSDPWLSGYSISYYYFGYVLISILIQITGTASSVAFNLAAALWFALTAISAYSVVYSLLALSRGENHEVVEGTSSTSKGGEGLALLGPIFVLVVSNIEGFLEMLHAKGVFWQQQADGSWHSSFWKWLDIRELVNPPSQPFSWIPQRSGGIWWWRASRVLQDYDMAAQWKEIIDEFPFFSYLLADLHPHVLAMPFVILAIGLALNYLILRIRTIYPEGFIHGIGIIQWLRHWIQDGDKPGESIFIVQRMKESNFWIAGLILGGLSFLNTWDFPVYVALFCSVEVVVQVRRNGWSPRRIGEFIELGLSLGIVGGLYYLPFYIGFDSQAGGILPSLSFFTRGIHLWVMFVPMLLPIFGWLFWLWRSKKVTPVFRAGTKFVIYTFGGLWLFSYGISGVFLQTNKWVNNTVMADRAEGFLAGQAYSLVTLGNLFSGLHGSSEIPVLFWGSLARRLAQPGVWVTLVILVLLVWSLCAGLLKSSEKSQDVELSVKGRGETSSIAVVSETTASSFVLLLILIGSGLVLVPEFIYLRDQFGWRINTIFKFYFQVWILWGLAAAYVSAVLWSKIKVSFVWGKWLLRACWVVLIASALAYPVFNLREKINWQSVSEWTFDGNRHIELYSPGEMAAIRWLQEAPMGVVAESIGGSYTGYARISAHTGLPTVLGWPGHESQWRGGSEEMGTREADIRTLYLTSNWEEAKRIIEEYDICYVYIGSLEHGVYRVNEVKFQGHLNTVFQDEGVIIYKVPDL